MPAATTSDAKNAAPAATHEEHSLLPETPPTLGQIIAKAAGTAARGGIAGAMAQVINVCLLMWLRTTMNYQYRYGGGTIQTVKLLYKEGGVPRFYRGVVPALMQAPLARFGDTAANEGALAFLASFESTRHLPVFIQTAFATCCAASFRIFLMPIDAWKTTKQVEGEAGLKLLREKIRVHGISKLWYGAGAQVAATAVGHYPWFFTYNYCNANLPEFEFRYGKYVRRACIGFTAAVVSDCMSNSIRVIKTTKQTSVKPLTYKQALHEVVAKDGYVGLFGRGLKTRILTNGMQGMIFTIVWKSLQESFTKKSS